MKKIAFMFLAFSLTSLFAAELQYSLIKKEGKQAGSTLFVIGGIHGDEPGSYFAPMLLAKHYTIEKGALWVVPNLNFDSIVKNVRGTYGDMNRKFAKIDAKDKDAKIVSDIKKLILEPKVDLVLNLHDGHGFYRPQHTDKLFNPKAWGQATIIDQQYIKNAKYGNLADIAQKVNQDTNVELIEDVHEFNVKNTNTKEQDKAMQQSLTYFAIKNSKPAFAIETSKNITELSHKVFYQLKTIENFMNVMDIKFSRPFKLTQQDIELLLKDSGTLEIPPTKIKLDFANIKSYINFFPISKDGLSYKSDNPLVAVIKEKNEYKIMNGNKLVARLKPDIIEFDKSLSEVSITVDGEKKQVKLGSLVNVKKNFKVESLKGYRTNAIGYSKTGVNDESGITLELKDFMKNYAIDKEEKTYFIHFYKDKKFCGIVSVKFD